MKKSIFKIIPLIAVLILQQGMVMAEKSSVQDHHKKTSETSPPNIIFIIADDMGYSDLGCYGGEVKTPSIDRIAAEGMRFRQFYNQAKCEPTRTAIMTGMYHGRAGLALQNPAATLGEAMRTGGYRTYIVGKWHLPKNPTKKEQTPVERGFDAFYGLYDGASSYFPVGIGPDKVSLDSDEPNQFITPYNLSHFRPHDEWGVGEDASRFLLQSSFPEDFYMTDAFGDHAVSFINDAVSNHPDKPFFLYLAFNAPHTPLQAPVPLIEQYRDVYSKGWDVIREEKWQRLQDIGLVDPHWKLPEWRDDIPRWEDLTAEQQNKEAHRRAVYAAMIHSMDQNIARVLDLLDNKEIAENTLVIFMSDNGAQAFDNTTPSQRQVDPSDPNSNWSMGAAWSSLSNMPFRYNKQSQHLGGNCTPFIVRWPAVINSGQITDEPGHIIDLMATFVDVGGADYNSLNVPPMDGASLLPVFEGKTRPDPLWGFEFGRKEFAVIKGDWKLVNFRSGPWRLFNLTDDRTEINNLAWKYPEKVKELAEFHTEWAMDVFGTTNRTYDGRVKIDNLGSQHMRYTEVLKDDRLGFYKNPPVHVHVSNIANNLTSDVSELHEIYTVKSSGKGIAGVTADEFTFTHKSMSGDGEVIIKLESLINSVSTEGLQAGIMIRQSDDEGSPFVFSGFSQETGNAIQIYRNSFNKLSESISSNNKISSPLFLRVKREGNTFTSSYSTGDYVWVDVSTTQVSMPENVLAGIAVASGSDNGVAEGVFCEWDIVPAELSTNSGYSNIVLPDDNIKIYPNPAISSFTISLPEISDYVLSIHDLTGRTCYKTGISKRINHIQLPEKFASGIFMIRIQKKQNFAYYRKIILTSS